MSNTDDNALILFHLPRPENEGSFCVGERIRYRACNMEKCPDTEPSFRAQQCSKFNNETYRGNKYNWLPYFDSRELSYLILLFFVRLYLL